MISTPCVQENLSFWLKLFGFRPGCIYFSSVLVHVLRFSGQVAGVEQGLITKNSIVFPLPSASVVGSM